MIGSTRSGKSLSAVWKILAAVMLGWAVVCIDPHTRSLSWNAFLHLLARGYRRRILFDRLSNLDRVLGYGMLHPSTARNPLRLRAENEHQVDQFTELVSRRSGVNSLATSPQKEEYTRLAGQFIVYQNSLRSLGDVEYVYEPKHPKFRELLSGCTHPDVKFRFEQVADGTIRPSLYAPAKRLIQATFGSPLVQTRLGATSFHLGNFLNERGILLVESGAGNVSDDAKRTIMGDIVFQTIQFIRSRRRAMPRVLLILDEAQNSQLIGDAGHEVQAMAECQKWGLDFLTLIQQDTFPTAISRQMFSNCLRHEWFFNANDTMCRQAAADLGDPELRHSIRQLAVGERYVRHIRRVYREQVPLLPTPWAWPRLAERKATQALKVIYQRSEYYRPEVDSPCQPHTSSQDEHVTTPSCNAPTSTSVRSDITGISSPATRLPTED